MFFFVTAVDDHGGRRGNTVQIITQWKCSVALREALIVLYWVMRAKLHRRIRMVIQMASKPIVFFHCQLQTKVIQ